MAEYVTDKLINANKADKALFMAVNSLMMEWNPLDVYAIPEKEYEFEAFDIFKILRETKDVHEFNEWFDEHFDDEYFEINAAEPEKQELAFEYRERFAGLILNGDFLRLFSFKPLSTNN